MASHLFTGTSELTELYLIDDIALTIVFGSGGAGKTANFLSRSTNSGLDSDIYFFRAGIDDAKRAKREVDLMEKVWTLERQAQAL